MLRSCLLIICALCATQVCGAADAVYGPLWLYNGTWRVRKKDQPKPDELVNTCAQVGKYFTCQQVVNGQLSALLVFLPAKETGAYYTQSIMPDGRAGGRGDLIVQGNTWTFKTYWDQGSGHSTFYQTINTFSGKDRIHFEQQESANHRDWKTTNSGDEIRIAPGKMTIAR